MKTLILQKPVIAVTGSSGKTTTKEMIASVLQSRWKIFKSPSNNNILPSTTRHAQKINASHQAVVLEYAMAARGIIKKHCEIIQPNIGVITNVGDAHIGNLGGNIKAVAAAKSELIRYMHPKGTLFINAADPNSALLNTGGFKGKIVRTGFGDDADIRGSKVEYKERGMSFHAQLNGNEYHFFIPVFGIHNVENALLAIAVCNHLGFSPEEIGEGLRRFHRPGRRLRVKNGIKGSMVLDDSYSSNPRAVKAAVDVLLHVGRKTKVVVLGDMLEMGRVSEAKHREVGKYLAGKDIDYLCTIGEKARFVGLEAVAKGMPGDRVRHFATRGSLHRFLTALASADTTFLVKGSHDTNMSATADYLAPKNR